jgi:hypothetical protein
MTRTGQFTRLILSTFYIIVENMSAFINNNSKGEGGSQIYLVNVKPKCFFDWI